MSSKKAKWKESFQKAKSLSQTSLSLSSSRKTSVVDEETSAKELEQYLETLNRKSGIKALWSGTSFEKAVRDEDDKTPDISISSEDDDQLGIKIDLLRFHSALDGRRQNDFWQKSLF